MYDLLNQVRTACLYSIGPLSGPTVTTAAVEKDIHWEQRTPYPQDWVQNIVIKLSPSQILPCFLYKYIKMIIRIRL